jgi:hypothetical protein
MTRQLDQGIDQAKSEEGLYAGRAEGLVRPPCQSAAIAGGYRQQPHHTKEQ